MTTSIYVFFRRQLLSQAEINLSKLEEKCTTVRELKPRINLSSRVERK